MISFQKIYGLYGVYFWPQIVQINGDVTMRDDQGKIELLSKWSFAMMMLIFLTMIAMMTMIRLNISLTTCNLVAVSRSEGLV